MDGSQQRRHLATSHAVHELKKKGTEANRHGPYAHSDGINAKHMHQGAKAHSGHEEYRRIYKTWRLALCEHRTHG